MWILLVEDEIPMGEMLCQGFREANHSVTWAKDGLEGIHSAEDTEDYDVLVTDVLMPGLDGVELVRRLRLTRPDLPVLILTARDSPLDVVRGLDAGADDYLTKPFSFWVLLARLRALARRAERPQVSRLQIHDLIVDPASRLV